jgi:putative heme transporter
VSNADPGSPTWMTGRRAQRGAKINGLLSTPPDPPVVPVSAGRWYRVWRVLRYVIGLAIAGVAIWAITGKTEELSGASAYLSNLRWGVLLIALGAEAVSYLALASMQRRLLLAGDVKVGMAPMTGISLASIAIQNSLPGGLVFYAAYVFRQYRRFGANDVLSGWTLVAGNTLSFISLSGLAAVGLGLALGAGSALDLVEVILGIFIVAALVVLGWVERARLVPHLATGVRVSQRFIHRPSPAVPADQVVSSWLERVGAISPSSRDWVWATTMSMGNWVADCACLALSFVAVGAGVPWRGLLLAYGAGQLASILPITPGGLGVVEGSLTVALVTFGGAQNSTVAAVLLYRLISFWLLLPVGWGAWGVLALVGRTRRPALETSST